jgi:alpha-beta hydrolase superfamily lysophospholipase
VAIGSVRELFGRLRRYRNRRRKDGGSPLLVIVGHSFGGMIVYSALAQSLIQAASAPVGSMTPEFADLDPPPQFKRSKRRRRVRATRRLGRRALGSRSVMPSC